MNIRIKIILFLFSLFPITIDSGCTKDHPGEETDNKQLKPIAIYDLDIPEPSGIVYNSKNNSLMVVSDSRPEIFEIDFTGKINNTLSISSSDIEGIALSKDCDTIYIVEEATRLVTTYLTTGFRVSSFQINVATTANHALEGITKNNRHGSLIILNEKDPSMILEYQDTHEIWRKEINYSSDISDIYFDEPNNFYWIVSDESQKILKLSMDAILISQWSIPIIQAEGITIVNNKIYIVSDAEQKLYIFQNPE
jgi:uncharacterized protein YjiK